MAKTSDPKDLILVARAIAAASTGEFGEDFHGDPTDKRLYLRFEHKELPGIYLLKFQRKWFVGGTVTVFIQVEEGEDGKKEVIQLQISKKDFEELYSMAKRQVELLIKKAKLDAYKASMVHFNKAVENLYKEMGVEDVKEE